MCLYPKRYINKKYTATEKNGGDIPSLPLKPDGTPDERILYIKIPCGQCIECRGAKAREWQVRLGEEIKEHQFNYFVTLTFSPEGLLEIYRKLPTEAREKSKDGNINATAGYAIRHCLERFRKDNKKSLKHWFVTELGHEGTERIHLHGILLSDKPLVFNKVERKGNGWMANWNYWKYGLIFVGDFVNQMSVNYVVKYMEKIDTDHKGYIGQIFCSPGIGRNFTEGRLAKEYKYRPKESIGYYTLPNGCKIKLPTYYKNKFYNETERETIWREFLDSEKQSIRGITYDERRTNPIQLGSIIQKQQEVSKELGYGDDTMEWKKKPYNITKRMLQKEERNRRMAEMEAKISANEYVLTKKIQNLQEKFGDIEKK